ncbi:ABC transporter permease [Kitasatospora sp. NPDC049258]|uniref:ABC transporter permease n=1 Tax=Kitasatospora sp. NPDC049258 TaxID=3155394 RepID=UPI00342AE181
MTARPQSTNPLTTAPSTTPSTTPSVPARGPATAAGPPARFRDLLAAEWLKLWSLRSLRWAFGVSALALVLLNANAAVADRNNWPHYDERIRAGFVPYGAFADSFTNNSGITLMLIAGSLGAITVVGEYSTGLVRAGFAAVPARRSLTAAKAAVLTVVMLGYGAVVAAASFGVTQAILSGRHIGISIGYPGVLPAVLASALLAPVSALIGLGLGALIRHAATTIVANVVVLLLVPNFLRDDHYWSAVLYHAMPFRAWQRLREFGPPGLGPELPFPSTAGGSWLVLALWPLIAVLLAVVVVDRRDL